MSARFLASTSLAATARRICALAASGMALALAGCATSMDGPSDAAQAAASPAQPAVPVILVPPSSTGTWVDLGQHLAPWLSGDAPVPMSGSTVPTRAVGLQRTDGRWLAVVVVQQAPHGQAPCTRPTSLRVTGSPSDGCLRLRRDADFDHWLEQQHPALHHWIDARGWSTLPRAWVSERVPAGGGTLQAHALMDPALIEPTTRNNAAFLAGGQPGLAWARQFAAATAASSAGAALKLPPFPFAAPTAAPPAPVTTIAAPKPKQAIQVPQEPPRPPAAAPRPDRG